MVCLPKQGFFTGGRQLFSTSIPSLDMDRKVLGYFGESDLLLSGFMEGQKELYNSPAAIWLQKGKGQIVLLAFSPVFRASMPATYKFLFNALLLPEAPPVY